ncbi:MAG: hypothetical protein M3250_04650 [Thermoproteota archaeon]|jgi:hypothetical protein|nr:hypothetical protein [Thermoproteota archaeon]
MMDVPVTVLAAVAMLSAAVVVVLPIQQASAQALASDRDNQTNVVVLLDVLIQVQ